MRITHRLLLLVLICFAIAACRDSAKEKTSTDSVLPKKTEYTKTESYPEFRYSILRTRHTDALQNDSLQKIIDSYILLYPGASIDSLINLNLEITARQLHFSFGKCSSDPNQLRKDAPANCVGYAALFNSCMNYTLKKAGLSDEYSSKAYAGKIWKDDKELTALINDPFFRDHDFNIITHLKSGQQTAVDPSLYDYLGYNRILLKEKQP